jgi:hypothetical protein
LNNQYHIWILKQLQKIGEVDSKQFLISFVQMGKKERDAKRRAFLESSRDAIRRAKADEEAKMAAQWSKSELRVDYNFSDEDFESAVIHAFLLQRF